MAITLISTVSVGAGGASSIDFNSIPGTYTDLLLEISVRSSSTTDSMGIRFNSNGSSYSMRRLIGLGSGTPFSDAPSQPTIYVGDYPGTGQTANTFGNFQVYMPNYSGSTYKSVSVDAVSENNATAAVQGLAAGLWSNTSAITSISLLRIDGASPSIAQYSTASLYGVTKGSSGGVTVA